jgi:cytoskeleton protein RodZ
MASLGQSLKDEREARHISIEEIASATKIVPRYLEALENDRLEIMPGDFFIKGIIRTYARAIGLDGDEVLTRYKAAGLIGEPERKRHFFQKPATEPVTPPPAVPALSDEPIASPKPDVAPAPELSIEPAPRPKLSPAARKRIFAWVWRTAAVLLVIAGLVFLWSSRRPRAPEAKPGTTAPDTVVAQGVLPPPQQTNPAVSPSTGPAAEPATRPEEPPAAEEVWKGVTIEISFKAETWIQVYTDGELKVDGLFPAGTSARAQADRELLIHTGNAGGFTFLLNGKAARPLGRTGQVLTDIRIKPDNTKDFLEVRPPSSPTG